MSVKIGDTKVTERQRCSSDLENWTKSNACYDEFGAGWDVTGVSLYKAIGCFPSASYKGVCTFKRWADHTLCCKGLVSSPRPDGTCQPQDLDYTSGACDDVMQEHCSALTLPFEAGADGEDYRINTQTCKNWCYARPAMCDAIRVKHCATGDNIISDTCKNFMKDPRVPTSRKTDYDRAWLTYCSKGDNFRSDQCRNFVNENPLSFRTQFDDIWERYCTTTGRSDVRCSCFDADTKWAGQPHCFKPECTASGYRTKSMNDSTCSNLCQSIVAGTAGNNATLRNINVQQSCQRLGHTIPRVGDGVGAGASPDTGTTGTVDASSTVTETGVGAPPTPTPSPTAVSPTRATGLVMLIVGVFMMIAAVAGFAVTKHLLTVVAGVIGLVLVVVGSILVSRKAETA